VNLTEGPIRQRSLSDLCGPQTATVHVVHTLLSFQQAKHPHPTIGPIIPRSRIINPLAPYYTILVMGLGLERPQSYRKKR
jgi:hypothetical protein